MSDNVVTVTVPDPLDVYAQPPASITAVATDPDPHEVEVAPQGRLRSSR